MKICGLTSVKLKGVIKAYNRGSHCKTITVQYSRTATSPIQKTPLALSTRVPWFFCLSATALGSSPPSSLQGMIKKQKQNKTKKKI